MQSYNKMILLVLISYFNPMVYFLFLFFYKSFESTIYYIVLSAAISMLAALIFRKIASFRFLFYMPSMLAVGALSSVFVLIVGQIIFTDRVIGYSELEGYTFITYLALAVFIPVFWVNVFIGMIIKYLEFRVSRIEK